MINRTMNLGKLAEHRERLNTLKIETHNAVVGIIAQFGIFDRDLEYVKDINPNIIKVNSDLITRKMKDIQRVLAVIKQLEEETGENIGGA